MGPSLCVHSGCESGSALNATCEIGCLPQLVPSRGSFGRCDPDLGASTASFQAQVTTAYLTAPHLLYRRTPCEACLASAAQLCIPHSAQALATCGALRLTSLVASVRAQAISCTPYNVLPQPQGNWVFLGVDTTADAYGLYGAVGQAVADTIPGSRAHHAVAAVPGAAVGRLVMFGGDGFGRTGPRALLNDLWTRPNDTAA